MRIHGIEIFAAEIAEVAGFFGAGADFGQGDTFEDGFERVEEIKIGFGRSGQAKAYPTCVFVAVNEHLFCAATAGDKADAGFDEADVGFGCGMNARGVEADFAATAKSHALRRGDDGFARVLDGKIDVLKLFDRHVELVPLLFLCGDEDEHEIGANGKIDGLIGDDHRIEICFQAFKAFVNHGDEVCADGVHLGVKFAADDAVAEVDEARAGVAFNFFSGVFERFQNDDAARLFNFPGAGSGEIENGGSSLFRFVKTFAAGGENFFDEYGDGAILFFELSDEISDAERVNDFERAEFPAEAPAHGAVDVGDIVGNFRDAAGSVRAGFGERAPEELLGFVDLLAFENGSNEGAKAFARVVNGFAGFERGEFCFLAGTVFERVDVEGENFFFAGPFYFFVKALTGFVAEHFAFEHFLDERRNFVKFA